MMIVELQFKDRFVPAEKVEAMMASFREKDPDFDIGFSTSEGDLWMDLGSHSTYDTLADRIDAAFKLIYEFGLGDSSAGDKAHVCLEDYHPGGEVNIAYSIWDGSISAHATWRLIRLLGSALSLSYEDIKAAIRECEYLDCWYGAPASKVCTARAQINLADEWGDTSQTALKLIQLAVDERREEAGRQWDYVGD